MILPPFSTPSNVPSGLPSERSLKQNGVAPVIVLALWYEVVPVRHAESVFDLTLDEVGASSVADGGGIGGVERLMRARRHQKYNPIPTAGPCSVGVMVSVLLATESEIFRYSTL
jgi:hypothetical protein